MEVKKYNLNFPLQFNSVCRICLTESTKLIPIHEINLTHNFHPLGILTDTPLITVLQRYCNVTVHIGDNKPQNICETCMNTLCHAYNVFELFLESNVLLDSLLHNHQQHSLTKSQKIKNSGNLSSNIKLAVSTESENYDSGPDENIDQDQENVIHDENSIAILSEDDSVKSFKVEVDETFDNDVIDYDNADLSDESQLNNLQDDTKCVTSDDNEDDTFQMEPRHFKSRHSKPRFKNSSSYNEDATELLRDHSYVGTEGTLQVNKKLRREKISLRPRKPEELNTVEEPEVLEELDNDIFECRFCKIDFEGMENVFEHLHEQHIGSKRCILCPKVFNNDDSAIQHVASHSMHGVACRKCQKYFKDKESLKLHQDSDKHDSPFTCNICQKRYGSSYKLKVHIAGMHESSLKRNYQCSHCGLMLKWAHNLQKHMLSHQEVESRKKYLCQFCAKSFVGRSSLNFHVKKVHEEQSHLRNRSVKPVKKPKPAEQKFQCETCANIFSSEGSLFKHRLSHPEVTVNCLYCDVVLDNPEKYKEHRRLEHSAFVCNVCQKGFPSKDKLICHRSSEHNPKTYCCTLCDATYEKSQLLKYHMLIHTGRRPYTCDYCGKGFKQLAHKTQHTYCVHAEKKFKCKICGKAFMFDSSLKNHLRSHTGEKPFSCPYCVKAFRDTIARHKHVKHDHPTRMEDFLTYKKLYQEEENKQARALCKTEDDVLDINNAEGNDEDSFTGEHLESEKVITIQNRDDTVLETWAEESE